MNPEQTPSNPTPDKTISPTEPNNAPAVAPAEASTPPPPAADAPVSTDPAPSAPAAPVVAPMSGRTKKPLIIGIIIAVILLLLGGGAAAAYYYVANKPENVLLTALANSFDTQKSGKGHASGAVSIASKGTGTTFEATYKLAADMTGAFDLSGELDVLLTKVAFDFRSTDGKTFYFKVGGLAGLPELLAASGDESSASYAPLLEAVNDQWIELSQNVIKQFDQGYESTTLSETDMQKMGKAYEQHRFLKVKESLPAEKIGGVNSFHFKVVADPTKLKDFIVALKDAKIESIKLTGEQVDMYKKALGSAKLDQYPVDVWIAKNTKLINQVSFEGTDDDTTVKARMTMDSYTDPVKVEKPADAKSFLELLGGDAGLTESLLSPGFESSGISL